MAAWFCANWLEIIKTAAPVITAWIAFRALKNWQRQDKAKREAEFLDSLIDAVHAYIVEMPKPTMLVEIAKIAMMSYAPTWEEGEQADKEIKGAIAYIQKTGEHDANRLADALKEVEPSVVRLKTLAIKGQIFKFKNYEKCQAAIDVLTWQLDKIEALTAMLASTSLNWNHPDIRKNLQNVMAIDPDGIRIACHESNTIIIEFARDTYERIYQ